MKTLLSGGPQAAIFVWVKLHLEKKPFRLGSGLSDNVCLA